MHTEPVPSKRFDLDKLFEGYLRLLQADAEYFSRLTEHNAELGRMNEMHLVKILRRYLPAKFGIGTGFIQCGGSDPRQSPQCDIIIYDAINNAPLYSSDAWSIFPIEMVYGVIEVKTTLDGGQLKDAFQKCSRIRAMTAQDGSASGNKSYQVYGSVPTSSDKPEERLAAVGICKHKLPPRFFIFGYGGFETSEGFEGSFRKATTSCDGAHVHGACCLNGDASYYLAHKAYEKADNRVEPVVTNGFRHFLRKMPAALDSMLPPHRQGLFFDRVNVDHYECQEGQPDGGNP